MGSSEVRTDDFCAKYGKCLFYRGLEDGILEMRQVRIGNSNSWLWDYYKRGRWMGAELDGGRMAGCHWQANMALSWVNEGEYGKAGGVSTYEN